MKRYALGVIPFLFTTLSASAVEQLPIRPGADAAAILVNISSSKECADKPSVAWLSKGRTLLYQADVSPSGTMELHTRSGEYSLVITGATGCFVEKTITVKASETKEIALKLDKSRRTPAGGGNQ